MTSRSPPKRRQTPPSRPVKKRGRYSAPPDGFVRYELDEEGSSEDPDFELEELDDDDESLDDVQAADEELSRALHDGRERERHPDGVLHPPLEPLPHAFHDDHPAFEVDDLDSSETEYDARPPRPSRPAAPPDRDVLDPPAGDDASDVGDVDDAELDDHDDDDDAEHDPDPERDGPPDEYVQFLHALLSPERAQPTSEAPPAASDAASPPSWALDDDDDFDYLRESARVQDDPLEFRDDLHVSRKELVQLLFSSRDVGLRPQTRRSRARNAPVGGRPKHSATGPANSVAAPVAPVPLAPTAGLLPVPPAPAAFVPALGTVPGTSAVSITGDVPAQTMPGAANSALVGLPAPAVLQLQEQLRVYTQILTTIYAENKKLARMQASRRAGPRNEDTGNAAGRADPFEEAATRAEALIQRLIENRQTSMGYHEMLSKNMSGLKSFSERVLNRDRLSRLAYTSTRASVYDLPVLGLLGGFWKACATADLAGMPGSVLQPLLRYFRVDVSNALSHRARGRQYSGAAGRAGWFAWTAQDDRLLAMTMAKYGSEFGEFSADLLPHRVEEDCQMRVRYLSSRRCADNAVKRQVMFIAAPLNRDEVALVRRGLELFAQRGLGEEDVWRKIQSELLPNREWSHLQKLWKWRETRRAYKAKYRARASQRKKAVREGAAQA